MPVAVPLVLRKIICSNRDFGNEDNFIDAVLSEIGDAQGEISLDVSLNLLSELEFSLPKLLSEIKQYKPNVAVKEFDISENTIPEFSDEEWHILLNSGFTALNLAENTLDFDGTRLLAVNLRAPQNTLKTLNLAGNYIGLEGARLMVDVLKSSRTLRSLNLNGIVDENGAPLPAASAKELALEVYAENQARAERRRSDGISMSDLPPIELLGDLFVLTDEEKSGPKPNPGPLAASQAFQGGMQLGR